MRGNLKKRKSLRLHQHLMERTRVLGFSVYRLTEKSMVSVAI